MMLKPLALGLLTAAALCSTAAFAGNGSNSDWSGQNDWRGNDSNWNQLFHQQGNQSQSQWNRNWNDWRNSKDKDNKDKDKCDQQPAAAPEIDPAGAMAALTLLAGGLAALRGRRSGKKFA